MTSTVQTITVHFSWTSRDHYTCKWWMKCHWKTVLGWRGKESWKGKIQTVTSPRDSQGQDKASNGHLIKATLYQLNLFNKNMAFLAHLNTDLLQVMLYDSTLVLCSFGLLAFCTWCWGLSVLVLVFHIVCFVIAYTNFFPLLSTVHRSSLWRRIEKQGKQIMKIFLKRPEPSISIPVSKRNRHSSVWCQREQTLHTCLDVSLCVWVDSLSSSAFLLLLLWFAAEFKQRLTKLMSAPG